MTHLRPAAMGSFRDELERIMTSNLLKIGATPVPLSYLPDVLGRLAA
jgi:hypothetical protein